MHQRFFSLKFPVYLHPSSTLCFAVICVLLLCYVVDVWLWSFWSQALSAGHSDWPSLQRASEYTGYLELDSLFTPGVSEGWFTYTHTYAYIHIDTFIHTHTHIHTHIHILTYTDIYTCTHSYTYTPSHTHTHIHTHIHIYTCTHSYTYTPSHTHIHTHTYTHIYTFTHIHTHTHTHTHPCTHSSHTLSRPEAMEKIDIIENHM